MRVLYRYKWNLLEEQGQICTLLFLVIALHQVNVSYSEPSIEYLYTDSPELTKIETMH